MMEDLKGFLQEAWIQFSAKKNDQGCWISDPYVQRGYLEVRELRHSTYETIWAPIPDGAALNLDCENSRCYNPAHMTVEEDAPGDRNGRAKLSARHVWWMRDSVACGEYTQAQLCEMSGVSKSTMSAMINRKTWKHV